MNLYHFRVSSGCLQLLREEHVTRWLKRNIVDRIHFDLSVACPDPPSAISDRLWCVNSCALSQNMKLLMKILP